MTSVLHRYREVDIYFTGYTMQWELYNGVYTRCEEDGAKCLDFIFKANERTFRLA